MGYVSHCKNRSDWHLLNSVFVLPDPFFPPWIILVSHIPHLLKQVFKEISKDDYFAKNNEFATWLKEEKGKYFSDLSSESARDLFLKFVKQWNKGKLPSQYYEGITSGPRSAHNWNIKAWGMFSFIVVCSMRHLVFSWRDFHLVVVHQTTSTTAFDLLGYCKADVQNMFLKQEGKS